MKSWKRILPGGRSGGVQIKMGHPISKNRYSAAARSRRKGPGGYRALFEDLLSRPAARVAVIVFACVLAVGLGSAAVLMGGEGCESVAQAAQGSAIDAFDGDYTPFPLAEESLFGQGGPEEQLFEDSENGVAHRFSLIPQYLIPPLEVKTCSIRKNDSLSSRLQEFGVPYSLILNWVSLAKDEYDFSHVRPGQTMCLWRTNNDEFLRFAYQINSREELVIAKRSAGYEVKRQYVEPTLTGKGPRDYPFPDWTDSAKGYNYYRGEIRHNFYSSAIKAGMTPSQAMIMIKIFSGVNFSRDLRAGDRFSLVTEMGENAFEEGPIVAAMLEVKGKPRYMFRYHEGDSSGYYDDSGKSTKRSTFIVPIRYKRISSLFTYRRYHPILHTYRPHLGVDFAAPAGTPVYASANGVVERKGYRGGYGYSITLRHDSGVKSMYNHLSKYAKGLKKGSRVKQGQTIAYCGSTGMSTGPHLDYRMFKDGKAVNPLKITSLAGKPVKDMKKFKAFKKSMLDELDADLPFGPPAPYFPDQSEDDSNSEIEPGGYDYDQY